jgi:SpoIID/LytB domain protein
VHSQIEARIEQIRAAVNSLENAVHEKKSAIEKGDKSLVTRQKKLYNASISHYKRSQYSREITLLDLFSESFAAVATAQKSDRLIIHNEENSIIQLALHIKNTEDEQRKLESQQKKLVEIKAELARQSAFLSGEIATAKNYQRTLSKKIAELSQKQKAILDARAAQFTASANNSDLSDDPNAAQSYDPGFRPAFAFFSIGAYTHRMGMSQYGAKGRADAGQNYKEILKAYFPNAQLEEKGEIGGDISVTGIGGMNFERNYLYGLAEMPASWHKEALKAQAIMGRTYALRYTGDLGREICATEQCQVHLPSKAANVPESWRQAVDETRGIVLKEGGEYAKAFYSSTTGGYTTTAGWDTVDGQFSDFLNTAWEKKARSPWFYKAWYRVGYSNTSESCGRSHPWLTETELADILNAYLVRKNGSSGEVDRIIPPTINTCVVGGVSGNPYSMDELARVADTYGGRYTSISNASHTFSRDGYTGEVRFDTNRGSISIPGVEFKQIFNLRAPGHVSIRNTLYAVEKK